MKAVAFSIKPFEKEFLAKANQKKHDITLISNPLNFETAAYAAGKDAVIVFTNDDVSSKVIGKLAGLGIKYIVTRSVGTDHIDKATAELHHIKLANVPSYSPRAIAEHVLALAFALNRKLIKANKHAHNFDFRNDDLIGFNFSGKTVGIIGLGQTGKAAALLFNSLGCTVLGFDDHFPLDIDYVRQTTIEELLANSDIISLHMPLTDETTHFIQRDKLNLMKNGVMLINTSRGAVIKTTDVLAALESGKVGYLGIDVYEYEKGLFFEDHENDLVKDSLLKDLLAHDNVLITPHQAYLTREALQEIADRTIQSLDFFQQKKCVGDACVCNNNCGVAGHSASV